MSKPLAKSSAKCDSFFVIICGAIVCALEEANIEVFTVVSISCCLLVSVVLTNQMMVVTENVIFCTEH